MFQRKCKITFIRHGSTIYTDEMRFQDNQNYPPLNEAGKIEAERIGEWVQRRSPKVDRIYTSSDLRTIQTCNYISKEYGIDFEILDNLYTRKSGLWNGLTFEQIEKKYPEMLAEYHKNRASFWAEGGETGEELCKRVHDVIANLIIENIGKRIIIVTHGDVIQTAIASALGIPMENIGRIYIPCGSASQISYYEDWASLVYSAHVPV